MSDDELLIDHMYRLTYSKPVAEWRSNKTMRLALTEARRFVLDGNMSAFLADLAFAMCDKRTTGISVQSMNFARMNARLPHKVIWIEYDAERYAQREAELGKDLCQFEPPEGERHLREGWLINGFPQSQLAKTYNAHQFRLVSKDDVTSVRSAPFAVSWRTDDTSPLVHGAGESAEKSVMDFLRGAVFGTLVDTTEFQQCLRQWLSVGDGELVKEPEGMRAALNHGGATVTFGEMQKVLRPAGMMTGLLRHMWPLLATINDLPIIYRSPARVVKGFMARAQYRRLLEHKVITLNVPQSVDPRKLARKVVADTKRRAHMVRGHWRKDFYHPLTPFCEHDFRARHQNFVRMRFTWASWLTREAWSRRCHLRFIGVWTRSVWLSINP